MAGANGHHGTVCTCSFPGAYKGQWDALVETAQNGELSTACVFLTAAQQGNHTQNPEDAQGRCFCHALYGEEKPWGCEWFGGKGRWADLVDEAKEKGQIVAVFYKAGYLKSIGAENTSWSKGAKMLPCELAWEDVAKQGHTMTDRGLGGSQRGEVAWLMKLEIPFMRLDVMQGAPDASGTAQMLGARADGLDLATVEGMGEGDDVAAKLAGVGAFDRAEALRRDIVREARKVLGNKHQRTLVYIDNLGELLQTQGKLDEARPLIDEALAGKRETLGDKHPDTLTSINNLGALLYDLGELDEAESAFIEAIEGFREVLGEDHPNTDTAQKWLTLVRQTKAEA